MKRALIVALSAAVIAGGSFVAWSAAQSKADSGPPLPMPKSDRISMAEFKKLLAANAVVVVDVRGPESYANGHIPGALMIPEGEINGEVAEKLKKLRKPVATYCS